MTENPSKKEPPCPPGYELITEEEHVRRLGFRLPGDRQQIIEDDRRMSDLRDRGFGDWERG